MNHVKKEGMVEREIFLEQESESVDENRICVKIRYCLENRMPVVCMPGEDEYLHNLVAFCLKNASDIRYLSFDEYYGKMTEHCIRELYPYIWYEEGIKWNVPYQDVTVEDFLRTFPETRKNGIVVYANNVAGSGEFLDFAMQAWTAFTVHLPEMKKILYAEKILYMIFRRR